MKEQKKLNNNKKNVIIIRILFNFRNKKVEYNNKKKGKLKLVYGKINFDLFYKY